jgi:bifunctional UDP-N-acetylglucosamine pyrophosphorylase / glucosamine-1-phosphate N-acetyltransferase
MGLVYDDQGNRQRLAVLSERGVNVWGPDRVYVGEDVRLERICAGAVLMNATITGSSTFIGFGVQIGTSGPARIHDAQIGSHAVLGAGTYENCVLLAGAKARGFAEIRQGTVLEEESEAGHNVGLKNTVFTAGVVAGSLINFCDVLLTGGSSRNDHSEVGSGVVHFNFDPRGDKFGSLMGDATGCLLKSRRIFVGGNSGVVAPVHLAFGAVVAAGSIVRKDVAENQLSSGEAAGQSGTYDLDRYFDLRRKFCTTAQLVGNLHALRAWYQKVRLPHSESGDRPLYISADGEFGRHIRHRVRELGKVIGKLEKSLSKPCKNAQDRLFCEQHRKLLENSDRISSFLIQEDCADAPVSLVGEYESLRSSRSHMDSVRSLTQKTSQVASEWLREIADRPYREMRALFGVLD